MVLSILETKKLVEIDIKDKSTEDGVKHYDIRIDFYPILLKGIKLLPTCRYGFTEFEVGVKMSTNGVISEYSQTVLKKLSKTSVQETPKTKTTTFEAAAGVTDNVKVKAGREYSTGTTSGLETTFDDEEAELDVLKIEERFVQWRYKDLPKLQRKELQSFMDLFFKWKNAKMPVKGFIKMNIIDADFRGLNKDLNWLQKAAARYNLKREVGFSLAYLEDINRSFEFKK